MASLILEYTFKDSSCIAIENGTVKYWISYGLPDYEGGWEGFETLFPTHTKELLKNKIIRINKWDTQKSS